MKTIFLLCLTSFCLLSCRIDYGSTCQDYDIKTVFKTIYTSKLYKKTFVVDVLWSDNLYTSDTIFVDAPYISFQRDSMAIVDCRAYDSINDGKVYYTSFPKVEVIYNLQDTTSARFEYDRYGNIDFYYRYGNDYRYREIFYHQTMWSYHRSFEKERVYSITKSIEFDDIFVAAFFSKDYNMVERFSNFYNK